MKILYGVCGFGLGHASRSVEIIRELSHEHEVLIISYDQAFDFLNEEFENVKKLEWFEIYYKDGAIHNFKTIVKNISRIPDIASSNFSQLVKIVRKFKPDVIVSDFEINSLFIGKLLNVPVITVSNQHMLKFYDTEKNLEERLFKHIPDLAAMLFFYPSHALIVTTFLKPTKKYNKDTTFFFGPIVRQEFLRAKPKVNDFFVGYFNDQPILEEFAYFFSNNFPDERLLLFGFKDKKSIGCVDCLPLDKKSFSKALIKCKGIFSHGGFSLLSEALLLKKPVCVFTSKNFYERYFNGLTAEKNSFGVLMNEFEYEKIDFFIKNTDFFSKKIAEAKIKPGNKDIARKIIELGKKLKHLKRYALKR